MPPERHPIEQRLLSACELDNDEQLTRLGLFFIGHTVMDIHLISVLVDHEVTQIGGVALLSLDRLRSISNKVTTQTFKKHLEQARALSLIPESAGDIAEEVNRARDAFVHFKRDRFEPPRYFGQAVTDEQGFRVCMDAIQTFLLQVPVPYIAWTANP